MTSRRNSCAATTRPSSDHLREKLTGQGPRPRLVGTCPGERRHGRSAPLTRPNKTPSGSTPGQELARGMPPGEGAFDGLEISVYICTTGTLWNR